MAQERLFVHLSDIHFDATDATRRGPNRTAREALIDDLRQGRGELGVPDAVLVTGDIAFSGQHDQYQQAREFLRRVTDTVDISPTQVQMVPGNHDVDRHKVTGSVAASHRNLRDMEPLEADKLLPEFFAESADPLFEPLSEYRAFAVYYECAVSGRRPYWEVDWPIGDALRLRMRGLTTVLVSDSDDRRANMLVGTLQGDLATESRDDVVMVLGHHPPDWWDDADITEHLMRDIVSIHLYGHKHRHHLSVVDSSVRLVAGAVHPERQIDWQPRYNWIRLSVQGEGTEAVALNADIWPRAFGSEGIFKSDSTVGGWQPDRRTVALSRLARRIVSEHVASEPRETTHPALELSRMPIPDPELSSAVKELARRPPVTTPSGEPTVLRQAIYQFGDLGYAVQTKILSELGLIEDDDRELSADELFLRAFERAREQDHVQDLIDRIAQASEHPDHEKEG